MEDELKALIYSDKKRSGRIDQLFSGLFSTPINVLRYPVEKISSADLSKIHFVLIFEFKPNRYIKVIRRPLRVPIKPEFSLLPILEIRAERKSAGVNRLGEIIDPNRVRYSFKVYSGNSLVANDLKKDFRYLVEGIKKSPFVGLVDSYRRFLSQESRPKNQIEFSQEHRQAGLQILNYFKETLDQKYPENDVSVKIGQEGSRVTMEISTPDGETELYEKALEDYGLVVTGQKPVEEYLDDKIHQAELKMKLEMAAVEIRNMERLLDIEREKNKLLLDDKAYMQSVFTPTLQSLNRIAVDVTHTMTSETGHFAKILELAEKAMASDEGVKKLVAAFEADLQAGEKEKVTEGLQEVEKKNPGILKRIWTWSGRVATKGAEKAVSGELGDLIQQGIGQL